MAVKTVTPTKSNLSALSDEMKLAIEGHGLLEQKREVFIVHLNSISSEIRNKRNQLDVAMADLHRKLALVRLETDRFSLDLIVRSARQDFDAEIIEHSIMGAPVPKLIFYDRASSQDSKIPMGLSGTSVTFDSLLVMAKSVRKLMAEVASLESTAWRLASEVKKTQRRINALENFVIPDTKDTIKFIRDILEEKDRETLFQIKRVKANSQKRSGEGL
ncbi:MAG: V-type ATP synthase subunit D [Brevinema sp.]